MRYSPRHRISDKGGRHRRGRERIWLPSRDGLRRAARSRSVLVAGALACLGLAWPASGMGAAAASPMAGTTAGTMAGTVASTAESRPVGRAELLGAFDRSAVNGPDVLDPAVARAKAAAAEEAARRAEEERLAAEAAWKAANPTPVGGLDQAQMNNALKIVRAGQALMLPKRAYVIAVATALQESRLYNLASSAVAESFNYPHEGVGSDHDSVGLFQQRASTGWGRVQDLMDPTYAATAFFTALQRVSGWETMALTRAAQLVQVSAYPYAYAKHEALATQIVDALVPSP